MLNKHWREPGPTPRPKYPFRGRLPAAAPSRTIPAPFPRRRTRHQPGADHAGPASRSSRRRRTGTGLLAYKAIALWPANVDQRKSISKSEWYHRDQLEE